MSATAASCCSGSRDTPSEHPFPVRTFPQPGRLGARLPRGEGAGGGHLPRGMGAAKTTLDSCPPALRPVLPPRRLQAPLPRFFVFFFLLETDSIHIEYNIFVYLTGRGGGGDRGGAGPAARYSSLRGLKGGAPPPALPPAPYCGKETRTQSLEFILKCVCVCVCVCSDFLLNLFK